MNAIAARVLRPALDGSGAILIMLGLADSFLAGHGDAEASARVYVGVGLLLILLARVASAFPVGEQRATAALYGMGALTLGATTFHLAEHPDPINGLPLVMGMLAAGVLSYSRMQAFAYALACCAAYAGVAVTSPTSEQPWLAYGVGLLGFSLACVLISGARRAAMVRWLRLRALATAQGDQLAAALEQAESEIAERTRAELELREREARLREQFGVIHALARSPRLGAGEVEPFVQQLTEAAARTLGVARVAVWMFTPDRKSLRCVDQYNVAENNHRVAPSFDVSRAPAFVEAIEQEPIIAAHVAMHDPRMREFAEWNFAPKNVAAALSAPIRLGGDVWGVLTHEHVGQPRTWSADEQTFAAQAADLVATVHGTSQFRVFEQRVRDASRLESLGVLAGGVAHDFNNLLTTILGNAEIAREALPEGDPRALVDEIHSAATRAAEFAQQMLTYAGHTPVSRASVDLVTIASEMSQVAPVSPGVELVAADPGAAPIWVEADATQLRQTVMNLITNASDAIGATGGRIQVEVGTSETWDDAAIDGITHGTPRTGRYAWVEVRDDGEGMDASVMSHMFDPFFSTRFQGRGLGLAAVLGIIRGHRGWLHVDSEVGKGTTMRICLPLARRMPVATLDAHAVVSGKCLQGRILVVDDDEGVRRVTARYLERLGVGVDLAEGCNAARELAWAQPKSWTAAVIDLTMPDGDGGALAVSLRQRFPQLPVLLVSGYDRKSAARSGLDEAPTSFLHKPYGSEELAAALEALLEEVGSA